jgi:hypothetical protein
MERSAPLPDGALEHGPVGATAPLSASADNAIERRRRQYH